MPLVALAEMLVVSECLPPLLRRLSGIDSAGTGVGCSLGLVICFVTTITITAIAVAV